LNPTMVEWSSLLTNKVVIGAVAATTAVVVVVAIVVSRQRRQKYEFVGTVSALNCFPIKSCGGITNNVAFCTTTGMRMSNALDRRFVIVRPNGDFITQRQFPRMAGIKVSIDGQDMLLNADGMLEIKVPLYPKLDRKKVVPCRVWKSHLEAQDCGQEVNSWISEYLLEDLRLLVLVQGLQLRQCDKPNALSKDLMGFPDDGPYHIATEESMADLQSRIGTAADKIISVNNFRPNIVIRGTPGAWDEDNWLCMKIGNKLTMRVIYPCDRCVMTTVDAEELARRADEEPLKTLRTFRTFLEISNAPLFGIFTGVDVESTIRIDDPVYVLRK
jgi:uncharacterized protein YcbX